MNRKCVKWRQFLQEYPSAGDITNNSNDPDTWVWFLCSSTHSTLDRLFLCDGKQHVVPMTKQFLHQQGEHQVRTFDLNDVDVYLFTSQFDPELHKCINVCSTFTTITIPGLAVWSETLTFVYCAFDFNSWNGCVSQFNWMNFTDCKIFMKVIRVFFFSLHLASRITDDTNIFNWMYFLTRVYLLIFCSSCDELYVCWLVKLNLSHVDGNVS